MNRERILVVDDEPNYVYLVKLNLEARGYEVLTARDGEQAVRIAAVEEPDLIILDIMMPCVDGYEACRQIRQFSQVPIIMLTARAEETSKVRGLDLGADDYLTKPFSTKELLARVRAALRRAEMSKGQKARPILTAGELRIDMAQRRVFLAEKEVVLTPTEYRLLRELARHAGKVMLSEHLLEAVWGIGNQSGLTTLRQTIYRLRQKLEPDPGDPTYIHTRSGLGYVFELPDD
ncbi:MAG: response regulator transcription factor [Anaerolineae bacterium]|jgi:DNA-binding response OmpR family regulator